MTQSPNTKFGACVDCGIEIGVERVDGNPIHDLRCPDCGPQVDSIPRPITITDADFSEQVEDSPIPVVVDCWADWCGPCRIVAPIIDALAGELIGRIKFAKLDIDANRKTQARFLVLSIPTLLIFQDGKQIDRIVGAQSKEFILERLNPLL